ncbi:malate dehydrogenase, partial [Klebsiella pneumoniae]|nr:malate dehydrogenase [Klebsiella pneumoniae]
CLSRVGAMQGEKGWVECAYVEGDGDYSRFSSQPMLLGKNGVEEPQSIGKLSAFEPQAPERMTDNLKKDIALGEHFINK